MMNGIDNANVSASNFQFLFDLGLRMNLARPKKKDSDHAVQHGMELGVKIPTINTDYYSFMGAELKYRRLVSQLCVCLLGGANPLFKGVSLRIYPYALMNFD